MTGIDHAAGYDQTQPPTHASRARNAQVNAIHLANGCEYRAAEVQALFAQSSATLALRHEQRIANVLAYLEHAEGDEYERLHADIKKGLGLS